MLRNIIENRSYHYELILRKPDKTPVSFVVYENLNLTKNFNDFNSLSFTVPKYLYNQKTKENYINPVWENIKAGWIIELQAWDSDYVPDTTIIDNDTEHTSVCIYSEYFSIEQPDFSASADENSKVINCVSRYQLVFNKVKLRGFSDTRKLFDCQYDANMQPILDVNGYPIPITYSTSDFTKGGVLNYILENILTGWKVGYYDPELNNVGKPDEEPEYSIDFFTGDITYETDTNNHTILKTGLRNYWTNTGHGAELMETVLATDTNYNPTLLYLDDTEKSAEQYISDVNNLAQKVDIATELSIENINAIMSEPLLGAQLLAKVGTMLSEMRGYMQNLYTYKYCDKPDNSLFPDAIENYIETVNEFCNAILDNLYSPLYYQYGTATGKIPYRTVNFENSTLTDVFKSLSNSFFCVFDFDSTKQLVNIYSRNNEAVDKLQTLVISPDNYMTSIQYQAKTDQIITRLYPTGKDGIWITDCNITGQRYIDDFSYFTQDSDSGMSSELISALNRYNALVSTHKTDKIPVVMWYYNDNTDTYYSDIVDLTMTDIVNKIGKLSAQISEAQQIARSFWLSMGDEELNRALPSSANPDTTITFAQRSAVDLSLESLNSQFTQIVDFKLPGEGQSNLRRVWIPEYDKPNEATDSPDTHSSFYLYVNKRNCENALLQWQEQFLYQNATDDTGQIFSAALLEELSNFIYEEDMTFENITNSQVLYDYSVEYLQHINTIPVTINLGLVDILSNYLYQMDWSKITDVGAKIHIEFKDFNLNLNNSVFKIMSYTHSIAPDKQDLSVVLSNVYELDNDYSKNLIDVWAESYKQIQDISTYRKTWDEFIAKQNSIILQGQTISSDINTVVNNAGNTIINAKGLLLGKSKGNALRLNADGYYSRDKAYSSTKSGTGYVSGDKIYPDQIEFDGADVSYITQTDGTKKLVIQNIGGGGSSGLTGLSRYYTAPFCSQKLEALDLRKGTTHVTQNESGQPCIYYAEMNMNGTNGGEYHYYMAKLIASNEETAVNGFEVTQFTDNAGRNMYYAVDSTTTPPTVDYNTLVYTTTSAPVMIYAATLTPTFEITRSSNHVPDIIFGIGNGTGDQEKWKFIKDENGGRFVYEDTNGLEQGIFMGVRTVDNVEEFGTYLIVDSVKVRAFGGELFDSYDDAVAATANMPNNTIGIYKM